MLGPSILWRRKRDDGFPVFHDATKKPDHILMRSGAFKPHPQIRLHFWNEVTDFCVLQNFHRL